MRGPWEELFIYEAHRETRGGRIRALSRPRCKICGKVVAAKGGQRKAHARTHSDTHAIDLVTNVWGPIFRPNLPEPRR